MSIRTELDSADFYVAQRQLRWLGHVARMDFDRLPRRMLSAWTPHKRPVGAPRLTYGRSMVKAMAISSRPGAHAFMHAFVHSFMTRTATTRRKRHACIHSFEKRTRQKESGHVLPGDRRGQGQGCGEQHQVDSQNGHLPGRIW